MKKITLLFILCVTMGTWSYSQCTTQSYQWPTTTVTVAAVPGLQTIAANNWPDNEFSVLTGLVIGESYTVTGALYITVTESDGTTIIDHGANSVSFVATVTDIMCFWTLDAACAGNAGPDTLTEIECTTCTCTETVAPGVPVVISPADGAIDVPIDITDPANELIGPFSWTDSGTVDNTSLSLGTDPAGTNIGTIPTMTNDNSINYGTGWEYSTTYFWSVESSNCFGSTVSAVVSFTTEADPALSIEDFENKNPISHFYNANTNTLTFKSSTLPFNNVEIYNILGQQVLDQKLSQPNESINLTNLTDGIYIAKVSIDGKTETFKFVKQ